MKINKKNYLKVFLTLVILLLLFLLTNIYLNKLKEDSTKAAEPITINLLTNVHPNLPWSFNAL